MSDHPNNMIAEGLTPETDAEMLAAMPKADGFPSFGCYELIQSGYPAPNHGEMILRPFGGVDESERLLPPGSEAMWVKREEAERLQSRLTAAETRVKELDRLVDLFNNRAEHSISCQKYTLRDCICGLNTLRAELDKLKGTK